MFPWDYLNSGLIQLHRRHGMFKVPEKNYKWVKDKGLNESLQLLSLKS